MDDEHKANPHIPNKTDRKKANTKFPKSWIKKIKKKQNFDGAAQTGLNIND